MKTFWTAFHFIGSAIVLMAQCIGADPVPPVVDPVPVAAISVVDAHGMPVSDEVGYGQQIVIGSDKAIHGKAVGSLVWIIEPQLQQFITPDGGTVVVTTGLTDSTISIMQLVALGDRVAFQRIKIKCGHGGQPPPVPPTPPLPPVPPITSKNLMMAVVYDDLKIPAEFVPIRNAVKVWDSFREQGDDWRYFAVTSTEPSAKKAISDAAAANVSVPALVLYDNETKKLIKAIPLPKTVEDLKAVRAKYKTGGGQ